VDIHLTGSGAAHAQVNPIHVFAILTSSDIQPLWMASNIVRLEKNFTIAVRQLFTLGLLAHNLASTFD
jgi:hypothetical protein